MRLLSELSGVTAQTTNQQTIKASNSKRVFDLIAQNETLTRAELTRITALSATTISALVDEMVRDGLLMETGVRRQASVGRRPVNVQINADGRQIPVFSLNHAGVRYALFNLKYELIETVFTPFSSERFASADPASASENPDSGDAYPNLFETILREKAHFFDPKRALAICVSHPGIYLPQSRAFGHSAMHVSIPLSAMLDFERARGLPVFVGNSSTALAYTEKKQLDHAGDPVNDLVYVNACEGGVGAGILLGGRMLSSDETGAGELGHVCVDYRGLPCACGARGCLEKYLSVDAFLAHVTDAIAAGTCEPLWLPEETGSLATVAAAYDRGDPGVRALVDVAAQQLFEGVYAVVCLLGVRRIVIGGGIEKLGQGFLNKVKSFASGSGERLLMRDLRFSYPVSGLFGDCKGIAEYYVDHAFDVSRRGETVRAV